MLPVTLRERDDGGALVQDRRQLEQRLAKGRMENGGKMLHQANQIGAKRPAIGRPKVLRHEVLKRVKDELLLGFPLTIERCMVTRRQVALIDAYRSEMECRDDSGAKHSQSRRLGPNRLAGRRRHEPVAIRQER